MLKVSEDQNISIEIQFYQTTIHNRNVSTSPPSIGMCTHNTWIAQCSIIVKSSSAEMRVICIDDFSQTENASSQNVDEKVILASSLANFLNGLRASTVSDQRHRTIKFSFCCKTVGAEAVLRSS